jgi:hypothetical protein
LEDTSQAYECIINLAGQALPEKRWNDKVKKDIYESRIQTTQRVISYMEKAKEKPKLLISGSAIGFYGDSLEKVFTENSEPATPGFPSHLCQDWEGEAMKASQWGVRVCLLRTGIVLGKGGGALAEMAPLFKLGLGAQMGDGQQWMSWIHREDVGGIIEFLIHHPDLKGPFNLTSPFPVRNREFTKSLAHVLHRPSFLKLPPFLVKILFGEMGESLLLKGQQVLPDKILKAGYVFQYPHLEEALRECVATS